MKLNVVALLTFLNYNKADRSKTSAPPKKPTIIAHSLALTSILVTFPFKFSVLWHIVFSPYIQCTVFSSCSTGLSR